VNREQFQQKFGDKIMILDGATGTELQRKGLPAGVCPELWTAENPEPLLAVHAAYRAAGSQVVTTNTFGANRVKLGHYSLGGRARELNERNSLIARRAVGDSVLVAGSVGPLGSLLQPAGDRPFDEAYECFCEQVQGLAAGGADIILIETMMDVQEARCALLAARDTCDLPVWVSLTFDKGRTLTGSDPVTALITLQSMGADVVGTNCGNGPEQVIPLIQAMAEHAMVPLLAQPNAGMPQSVDGRTVFTMGAREFGAFTKPLLEAGASLIGGCCGTDPDYIAVMASLARDAKPRRKLKQDFAALTSLSKTVFLGPGYPTAIIGEQLNPSGRKKLSEELARGETTLAKDIGIRMAEQGADVININVGAPLADQSALMKKLILDLSVAVRTPLALDSAADRPMVEAIPLYPGRALINSISGERSRRDALLPLVKRYGAMFVLMPLDERGVPQDAKTRIEIIRDVVEEAQSLGIPKSSIIVDGLVLAESSRPGAARQTLEVLRACSQELGLLTMCGLSNISFGLPERGWVDGAFLAMCVEAGISAVNANPGSEVHRALLAAADALAGRDPHFGRYIERMQTGGRGTLKTAEPAPVRDEVYEAVLKGKDAAIGAMVARRLENGEAPLDLINNSLVPAITEVGQRYSCNDYFLPQLLASSKAAQEAFAVLDESLEGTTTRNRGRVVLATVRGDIHDIGKNLVGVLLKNHGFQVIDLGIDASPEAILKAAREEQADLIGLSALMTTTMLNMRETIALLRKQGVTAPVLVGGAVLSQEYAQRFGADGYAKDAVEAVRLAVELVDKRK